MSTSTIEFRIECPCCGDELEVNFIPPEPAVHYPNDKAYPGAPAGLEFLEGCECADYVDKFEGGYEDYFDRAMDKVMEQMT